MNKAASKKIIKRRKRGVVVSDKMDKTIVVAVESDVMDAKYLKKYKVTKKYKAHDAKNEYKVGEQVLIEECRPLSREKRWRVIKKVTSN